MTTELPPDITEELLSQCIATIHETGKANTSTLQRRHRLGYVRAVRILDILAQRKLIGPEDPKDPLKPRGIYAIPAPQRAEGAGDVFRGFKECAENQVQPPPQAAAIIDQILSEGGDAKCTGTTQPSTCNAEERTSNPSLHPPTAPIALPVRAAMETLETALGICFADSHVIKVEFLEEQFPDSLVGKCIRNIRAQSEKGKTALVTLSAVVTVLSRELEDAKAWKEEINGAIQRSGLGILRTSQGPVGTMICTRPEVEEAEHAKVLELIHENVDLKQELTALRAAPRSETEGRDTARLDWLEKAGKQSFSPLWAQDWIHIRSAIDAAMSAPTLAHEPEARE